MPSSAHCHIGVAPTIDAFATFGSSLRPRALTQIGHSQSFPPPSANCWNSRSSGGQPSHATPPRDRAGRA
jgi:hypothetical protein